MAIVRWEPLRDLLTTQDRFNRLLNGALSQFFGDDKNTPGAWSPAVDIYETDSELVLKAELPGVNPKDVEVRVEDNTLYLKGQRNFEREVKEENFHRLERGHGSFSRSFALPSSIDSERVKAEYKNGLLTLTMPKKEEAKPKTIPIIVSQN